MKPFEYFAPDIGLVVRFDIQPPRTVSYVGDYINFDDGSWCTKMEWRNWIADGGITKVIED